MSPHGQDTPHLILTPSLKTEEIFPQPFPSLERGYFGTPLPPNNFCLFPDQGNGSFKHPMVEPVPTYAVTPVPAFQVYGPGVPCGLAYLNGIWSDRQQQATQENINRYLNDLGNQSLSNKPATKETPKEIPTPESALRNCSYMPALIKDLIQAEIPETTVSVLRTFVITKQNHVIIFLSVCSHVEASDVLNCKEKFVTASKFL